MKTRSDFGPQFLRLTPQLEEDPPPREVGCPLYRECLGAAAAANFALDCSRCPRTEEDLVTSAPGLAAAACA
ncbi:MAG: hypothetical protein WHT06_02060 [Desulfobacterales bacterium]